jgi:hypothetical protein
MAKEEKKISTRDKVIGGIIFLVIVLGIAFGVVWWSNIETQKMLDKGCIASAASNYLGTPTYWSCPDPKETQKFIDRGCTPMVRDETGTTWSCPK